MMRSSSSEPPVLILGAHVTALGVLRVLSARGIECYCAEQTSDIIVRSRWYRPAERTLPETADSDVLAAYLDALQLPRAVLIACSDRWISAVAGLPDAMRDRFPSSAPPVEAVEQFIDKARFRRLVERLGIPHPRTTQIVSPADLDRVSDAEIASGFLKPTDSQRYYQHFGDKGSFVESRTAAARIVEKATSLGITFLLQEWIPGDLSRTVLLDGFVDRDGVIRAFVARRRIRMDPPRLANTASAVTIPLQEVSEAVDSLRGLLSAVRYRGAFNVEFKQDGRDGQFKIIEVNPRPAWYIAPLAAAGVDLSWKIYLDAQGLPVPDSAGYRVGRYGFYEIPDAAAILRAVGSFRRPDGPVLRPWLRGDRVVFWWRDPMPGVADVGRSVRRRTVSAARSVLGGARRNRGSAT